LKKGFSLIELLIVIVIVGVIYTLAVTNIQTLSEQKMTPSFSNLKEYLHSFLKEDAKTAKLLCLDDCSECGVYIDGAKQETIESFFDSSVEVYRYDFLLGAQSIEPEVYFNEEDVQERVCFSYEIGKNLIGDQVLIVYKNRAYDYTTYFTQTPVYDSISELIDAKEELSQKVSR